MSISAKELAELLQTFKDFGCTMIDFQTGDVTLRCNLPSTQTSKVVAKRDLKTWTPESKLHSALQSNITADELEILGLAGVDPNKQSS